MKWFSFLFCCALLGCGESSKRQSDQPLQAVSELDINRYQGKWYEIARFPFSIQEGCVATTATYTLREDGKLDVLNECRVGSVDGKLKQAQGVAELSDDPSNAKLKVSFNFFMGLFGGANYWVIDLAEDYSYAVVSEPKGRYLWILSRTPQLEQKIYDQIVDRLRANGFMVEYLQFTDQPSISE
jgi:apolipoprotein D and lipocalin family protein